MSVPEPPASRRQSRRDRELANRRTDAIDGAAAVFAAKGFHDAQMTEIAAAAELSLASLYSMFKGKEELYSQVMRTATERMRKVVLDAVAEIEDPVETLLSLIDAVFECFEAMHDLTTLVMSTTQGLPWNFREQLGAEGRASSRPFMEWIVGLAREAKAQGSLEGIDPEVFSRTLIGSISITAAASVRESPNQPFTKAAPTIRAIFERVLRPAANA